MTLIIQSKKKIVKNENEWCANDAVLRENVETFEVFKRKKEKR